MYSIPGNREKGQPTCPGGSLKTVEFSSNKFELPTHRKRIKTEEKAKVVASVWGEEFIQFLAALAVLPIIGRFFIIG